MKRLAASFALLLIAPIALLNPLGREAFLGYYVGIFAMWLTFAGLAAYRQRHGEQA